MATLYITELNCQGVDNGKHIVPAALMPALDNQAITISSTSAQSAALEAATTMVRLYTDTACFVLFGANPTALTTSMPLAAGAAEYFCVIPNTSVKIAARTA